MPLYHHKLNYKVLDEYKSSELTMPSDGLVFYASLRNSINAESGHNGNSVVQSYEFVTENGIQCIKSNSNNAVIQYPTWSEITGNNSLSISFWMKGKCEHQDDNIITYGTWVTDSLRAARFMGSGSSALLGCEAGDDFVEGGIKTTDNDGNSKWMHIVVIFEDLNDEFEYRVYGNTTLGYIKHRSAVNTTIDSSRRGLFLFSKPDTGGQHYNGCLCAVRLYNRVLSQEEITTLSQEFVPIDEYSTKGFDDFGFSIPYDSAWDAGCSYLSYRIPDGYIWGYINGDLLKNNTITATNTGVTADSEGFFTLGDGKYFTFDELVMTGNSPRTFIFQITFLSTNAQFVSGGSMGDRMAFYMGWGKSSDKLFYHFWGNAYDNRYWLDLNSGSYILAIVYTGSTLIMYKDGDVLGSTDININTGTGETYRIGQEQWDDWGCNGEWKSKFFAAYDRALTQEEIASIVI